MNIGQNIYLNRTRINFTQEQLSEYLHLTKATISKWENNQATPDIHYLVLMANLFNISVDDLIGHKKILSSQERSQLFNDLKNNKKKFTADQSLANIEKLSKQYLNDYKTLLMLVQFMVNSFLDNKGLKDRTAQLALALLNKIISHASAETEIQSAIMLKVIILFQNEKYDDIIEIYHNRPYKLGEELILANSYALKGDIEKAKEVLQVELYQQILLMVESLSTLISYETKENSHEIIRRMTGLIELFKLEELHPNSAIKCYYTLALYYIDSEEEKAITFLGKLLQCCKNLLKQFQLHGDSFFYTIDDWLESLPMGTLPPTNKKLLINQMEETFNTPVFAKLNSHPQFQSFIKDIQELKKELQHEPYDS
ncbi:helix-turn-helix domain-containing protein [Streptococcus caviae]|uniref:helix-turn-helix domain-containing protein n=1 Tax=Streptococcus sp. 'caviae' TaxID=1915004 RepID=UPI00094B7DF1|nr:helix-turn-helix transcriptional regulator [Streptococcus sp. 'caviae']OLN84840.1 transcriptional regulator [Streptococcus sp. 'caviae']